MAGSFDLYCDHFGLSERPFSLVPDPAYIFWSPAHRRAYTMLEYGVYTQAPITLITGEVGAGKTTLVLHLINSLPDDVTVGYVTNSHAGRGEMLLWILMSLSLEAPSDASYVDLFRMFQDFLIEEYAEGRRVVLIFDEAQNLDREALEELRMFTNINSNKNELLQLILVGQPELRDMVRQPDLVQFAQRVSSSFHLPTMDEEAVTAYVTHRMDVAGASHEVFTEEALSLIHGATKGIPRLVNQLSDLCLVYAAASEDDVVDRDTFLAVLKDGAFFSDALLLENRVS